MSLKKRQPGAFLLGLVLGSLAYPAGVLLAELIWRRAGGADR